MLSSALEKCLKAYLVYHETDFSYTHNISRLHELCAPLAPWGSSLLEAEELTPLLSPPGTRARMKWSRDEKPRGH